MGPPRTHLDSGPPTSGLGGNDFKPGHNPGRAPASPKGIAEERTRSQLTRALEAQCERISREAASTSRNPDVENHGCQSGAFPCLCLGSLNSCKG